MTRARRKTTVSRDRIQISSLGSDLDDNVNERCEFEGDNGDVLRKKRRTVRDNEGSDNVGRSKSAACLLCDEEDDRVLVCSETECPVAIHGGCMSTEPNFDELKNFLCPYCWYKRVKMASLMLKEKVMVAQKALKTGKTMIAHMAVTEEKGNGKPKKSNLIDVNRSLGKFMSLRPCENRREDGELCDQRVESEKSEQNAKDMAGIHKRRISNDREVQMLDTIADKGRRRWMRRSDRKQGAMENDGDQVDMVEDEGCRQQACLRKDYEFTNMQGNGFRKDEQMEPDASPSISSPISTNNVDDFVTGSQEFPLVVNPVRAIVLQPTNAWPLLSSGASSMEQSFLPLEYLEENRICHDRTVVASSAHKQRKNDIYHDGKRKRLFWTPEEEEMLRVGVQKFSILANKNMPWRKVLEFGRHVFHEERTPTDLKDKWKNMTKLS